jgi:hypothetical protein
MPWRVDKLVIVMSAINREEMLSIRALTLLYQLCDHALQQKG